jgi:hypothetical protein
MLKPTHRKSYSRHLFQLDFVYFCAVKSNIIPYNEKNHDLTPTL